MRHVLTRGSLRTQLSSRWKTFVVDRSVVSFGFKTSEILRIQCVIYLSLEEMMIEEYSVCKKGYNEIAVSFRQTVHETPNIPQGIVTIVY